MSEIDHRLQWAFCWIAVENGWRFLEDAALCEWIDDGWAPCTASENRVEQRGCSGKLYDCNLLTVLCVTRTRNVNSKRIQKNAAVIC